MAQAHPPLPPGAHTWMLTHVVFVPHTAAPKFSCPFVQLKGPQLERPLCPHVSDGGSELAAAALVKLDTAGAIHSAPPAAAPAWITRRRVMRFGAPSSSRTVL